MMPSPINEHDLHAYIDGELDAQRAAEVEAFLADNPSEAARVRHFRQQNAALRKLFDPIVDEPVAQRFEQFSSRRPRDWRALGRYGAIAAALVLAVALGWTLRGLTSQPGVSRSLAQQAMIAHAVYAPEVLHPVEVGASEEAHLSRWLTKRLGVEVKAPDLGPAGFELIGGRLLPNAPKPAAQFMYQNAAGARLTLFVTPQQQGSETAFRYREEGGLGAFYWIDRNTGYALSGEADRATLLRVAKLAYHALDT